AGQFVDQTIDTLSEPILMTLLSTVALSDMRITSTALLTPTPVALLNSEKKVFGVISQVSWSFGLGMLALCPNTEEVHIYRLSEGKWDRVHVLLKHDQVVCGIDWSSKTNKIVTVSHDRNSYVWNQEAGEWVPTLVILRLNRAALCVQWSPKENKFAVGSGAKTVCICYYEQDNNWAMKRVVVEDAVTEGEVGDPVVVKFHWVLLKVLGFRFSKVAGMVVQEEACELVSCFLEATKEVFLPDLGEGRREGTEERRLRWLIAQVIGRWWVSKLIRKKHNSSVTSVAWHPNNILLATTSTDGKCRVFSTFIKGVDTRDSEASSSSETKFGEILFVSEKMVVGVGFDFNPMVFAADESGLWSFIRFLGERQTTPTNARYGSQLSGAFGKLYGQSKYSNANDTVDDYTSDRSHDNCITRIVPLKKGTDSNVTRFSTSGLDGKVIIWDLGSQDLADYL
ncbi:hypothetical protein KSS87_010659, partial [Heliosperma pusillum]